MNLVVNARDAMPGGGRIDISTENLTVSDAGRPSARARARRLRGAVGDRHRRRHERRDPAAHLRAVLLHQGRGRHRPRPVHRLRHRAPAPGRHRRVERAGRRARASAIYLPQATRTARGRGGGRRARDGPGGGGRARGASWWSRTRTTCAASPSTSCARPATRCWRRRRATRPSGSSSDRRGPIHLLLTDVVLRGMNGRELAERFVRAYPRRQRALHVGLSRRRDRPQGCAARLGGVSAQALFARGAHVARRRAAQIRGGLSQRSRASAMKRIQVSFGSHTRRMCASPCSGDQPSLASP